MIVGRWYYIYHVIFTSWIKIQMWSLPKMIFCLWKGIISKGWTTICWVLSYYGYNMPCKINIHFKNDTVSWGSKCTMLITQTMQKNLLQSYRCIKWYSCCMIIWCKSYFSFSASCTIMCWNKTHGLFLNKNISLKPLSHLSYC